MSASLESHEQPLPSVLDIPLWWGNTREEFKARVVELLRGLPFSKHSITQAPRYDVTNSDGSVTPFYPILCAVSPEWGVITREEIAEILYPRFVTRACSTLEFATSGYADYILDTEYLAWGLENKVFLPDEIAEIRFDGDTPESYIREYGNPRLVNDVIDRLIHPSSPVPLIREKVARDVDLCCCDCCC